MGEAAAMNPCVVQRELPGPALLPDAVNWEVGS